MFDKVLVANRGEIAVRIIRALRELGISSVAVYSDADRASLHVRRADQAVAIGPAPASESYLRIDRILEAAQTTGATAIHPGYGFLSENADFAQACLDAGLAFIGPPPDAIRRLGEKTAARRLALEAGVPIVPGSVGALPTLEAAVGEAGRIGYPVLLKAAAGGGGKGMRIVEEARGLAEAWREASSEAIRSFGSPVLYLEKALRRPRHIEIQVLGDLDGSMIHLGERECSLQRRHQKLLEESPSPLLAADPELRERMGAAAIRIARAAGYANAGTVEFLVDESEEFYFLEMNTRLQVEHPVTELVTGLDLVHAQLRLAAGEPIPLTQDQVQIRGSAIECRLLAEDPDENFLPSPGRISRWLVPSGPGIRVDSGVYSGWDVPLEYDPLLAKLIVWAQSREVAIARLGRALEETVIEGVRSNLSFFSGIIADAAFAAGHLHTHFVGEFVSRNRGGSSISPDLEAAALLAALAGQDKRHHASRPAPGSKPDSWLAAGRQLQLR